MSRLQPKIKKSEQRRLESLMIHERQARDMGFQRVAGVDEAGRGPLAGPVVAAACILPEGFLLAGIDDSKQLLPKQREELYDAILATPGIHYAVCCVDSATIDRINILQATLLAMRGAIEKLSVAADYLLVDGIHLPMATIPGQAIIKGDSLSQSIAAASILAKETRDRMMCEYHQQWPHYGFDKHKGYGTELHLEAIAEHGPCPIHRMSFAPLKKEQEQLSFLSI